MALAPVHLALLTISGIGLILNIAEQIFLYHSKKLHLSFSKLIFCLSCCDCFISLSTMGRVSALVTIDMKKYSLEFHSITFSFLLFAYLSNSVVIWVMTGERMLAVCFPLVHRRYVQPGRTIKLIIVLSFINLLVSVIHGVTQYRIGLEIFLVGRFLAPVFITTFLVLLFAYSFMFYHIRKINHQHSTKSGNRDSQLSRHNQRIRNARQRKVLYLSFRIVMVFQFCTALFVINLIVDTEITNKSVMQNLRHSLGVCLVVMVTVLDPINYYFGTGFAKKKAFTRKNVRDHISSSAVSSVESQV